MNKFNKRNVSTASYKAALKDILKDLNKWENFLSSWIGR